MPALNFADIRGDAITKLAEVGADLGDPLQDQSQHEPTFTASHVLLPNNPSPQRQGAGRGQFAQRHRQRDDLPAAAHLPAHGAVGKQPAPGRDRRRGRFRCQLPETVVGGKVGPGGAAEGVRCLRLFPAGGYPTSDRPDRCSVAAARAPGRRSRRQGDSHFAPRRVDCRLDRSANPRAGLRISPGDGPSRRRHRTPPSGSVSLAMAGSAADAVSHHSAAGAVGRRAGGLRPPRDAGDRAAAGKRSVDAQAVRPQLPAVPGRPADLHAGELQ